MKFNRRTLMDIRAALSAAISFEKDLAEAYAHMKKDPAYGMAIRTAKKYARIRLQISNALNGK